MNCVVTGGAGFIATTLIRRLLDSGAHVLALDNLSRGTRANIGFAFGSSNFSFENVDLNNLDQIRAVISKFHALYKIESVWHLAANSDIPAGVVDPTVDLRDTFMTTFNMLFVMREFGIRRLMFSSSSAIYGDIGMEKISESAGPLFPISNYGAMKLASEAQITAAAESFLDQAVIFRFPNVVGVPATHGVILDFVNKLKRDSTSLPVLGNGTQQKSYLHVSDLVDGMLFIRDECSERVAAFNIGPLDEGVTVKQIAEEVVAHIAPGARLQFGMGAKGWVGDVPRFSYSIEKLKSLGWTPQLDSLTAIRKAIVEIATQEGFDCKR